MKTSFAIWRKLLSITQAHAAHVLGLNIRTVERYETGEIIPSRAVRRAMYTRALLHLSEDDALRHQGEWPIDPRHIPAWTMALVEADDSEEDDFPGPTSPASDRVNSPASDRKNADNYPGVTPGKCAESPAPRRVNSWFRRVLRR